MPSARLLSSCALSTTACLTIRFATGHIFGRKNSLPNMLREQCSIGSRRRADKNVDPLAIALGQGRASLRMHGKTSLPSFPAP